MVMQLDSYAAPHPAGPRPALVKSLNSYEPDLIVPGKANPSPDDHCKGNQRLHTCPSQPSSPCLPALCPILPQAETTTWFWFCLPAWSIWS